MNRTPRMEQLEPRQLLNGNVTAVFNFKTNDVTITGDNAANNVTITQTIDPTGMAVIVTPDFTTSVNHNAPGTSVGVEFMNPLVGPAATLKALNIRMGKGNGVFNVESTATGSFTVTDGIYVDMGTGNNTLLIGGVTTTNTVTIKGTSGTKTITVGSFDSFGGSNIGSDIGTNLLITPGSGNATVKIDGVIVANVVKVTMGKGTNTCTLDGGPIAVLGHSTVDTVITKDFEYNGGSGNDTVVVGAVVDHGTVTVNGHLAVALGGGTTDSMTVLPNPTYDPILRPTELLSVGGVFKVTGSAKATTVNVTNLDAVSTISISLTGTNDTVILNNVTTETADAVITEKGTGTDRLTVNGLVTNMGIWTGTMSGRTANVITATGVVTWKVNFTGVAGVSTATLSLPFMEVYGPPIFKNFHVIGPS